MVVLRERRRGGSGVCGGWDREVRGEGEATEVLCPRGWHQVRVTFKVG